MGITHEKSTALQIFGCKLWDSANDDDSTLEEWQEELGIEFQNPYPDIVNGHVGLNGNFQDFQGFQLIMTSPEYDYMEVYITMNIPRDVQGLVQFFSLPVSEIEEKIIEYQQIAKVHILGQTLQKPSLQAIVNVEWM